MKSILLSAVALSFAVSVLAEEKPPQLKDLKDKASYAIGLNVGFNFKRQKGFKRQGQLCHRPQCWF